ncbi:acyl carrier protein [Tardiphaga alba]|uniref:Acyl carrier protein n=1 Tax=Tardiphaga alba TaxID=340268 RepID=A0ABX8A681_9BRAD|nr:acyl carrier protein [Tardiphaga alba]QUS38546.1 acyl carrier protein [Tardiphaga alba]
MTTGTITDTAAIGAAITGYLQQRFPLLGAVDTDTPLLGSAAIDSLGFLEVVTFLEEQFGIALDDDDFDADNLKTPAHLVALVERKLP